MKKNLGLSKGRNLFSLDHRVAVITGGAGLLGEMHAEAVAEAGGVAVLADVDGKRAERIAADIRHRLGGEASGIAMDVTNEASIRRAMETVVKRHGHADILINNAARNPKVEGKGLKESSRLENYPVPEWNADIAVGLTGAFLCSRVIGGMMAEKRRGVIVNIASDLGLIAPDQRIYRKPGLPEARQKTKPVSYSVVKGGLVMLTKYLATYWAEKNVRVNTLCPGGVYDGQPDEFVVKLTNLIPMGRMANRHEYKGAIVFLCSDAASYMTGSTLVIDGGRTTW